MKLCDTFTKERGDGQPTTKSFAFGPHPYFVYDKIGMINVALLLHIGVREMYKKKLCLSASKSYGISLPEQIRLFKKTGFEGFFVLWQKGMDEEI